MMDIHATALKIGDCGVLIRGESGAGKSTLALCLLQRRADARLIADDRVILEVDGGTLKARAPERLVGLLEVRGLGIVRVPFLPAMTLTHCIDLVMADMVQRLPAVSEAELLGNRLARLDVAREDMGRAAAVVLAFLDYPRLDPDGPGVGF